MHLQQIFSTWIYTQSVAAGWFVGFKNGVTLSMPDMFVKVRLERTHKTISSLQINLIVTFVLLSQEAELIVF